MKKGTPKLELPSSIYFPVKLFLFLLFGVFCDIDFEEFNHFRWHFLSLPITLLLLACGDCRSVHISRLVRKVVNLTRLFKFILVSFKIASIF